MIPQEDKCVEATCGIDFQLINGVCASKLSTGYSGTVASPLACNATPIIHQSDWICDKCTNTPGPLKCIKCIEGKTCTLDCTDYPWGTAVSNYEGTQCVVDCPVYSYIDGASCSEGCDIDCLDC